MSTKPRDYGINFDTSTVKSTGLIKYTKITIGQELLDLDGRVNIALCDDPLYPELVQYVLANPPRK